MERTKTRCFWRRIEIDRFKTNVYTIYPNMLTEEFREVNKSNGPALYHFMNATGKLRYSLYGEELGFTLSFLKRHEFFENRAENIALSVSHRSC